MGLQSWLFYKFLSPATIRAVRFDLLRRKTRRRPKRFDGELSQLNGLHLGCGPRRIGGWLNVDLIDSDFDLDLGSERLPFPDAAFRSIASQHLIEHLEMTSELLPLLRECHRVLIPGGSAWLSCPDISKICHAYVDDRCANLVKFREVRHKNWRLDKETKLPKTPTSYMANSFFNQQGEHRNLFDFELLSWLLRQSGFEQIEETSEAEFLLHHSEFPSRKDSDSTLYVRATK